MAITIEVFPQFSPRIIRIPAPTTDVVVQDIYNAIRDWEDELPDGIQYDPLVSGGGKEALGGGVTVGITITLLNAQLMFAARPDSLSSGSATSNSSSINSIQTLTDTVDGAFLTDVVARGDTVFNATTGAMEAIIFVSTETQLKSLALGGGTRQDWQIGDQYIVYPNVQCNITGGNLVAVDDVGAEIHPVVTSPNTQVVRSSSASATLQELSSIQFSSYSGGVTVDVTSSNTGTAFPTGTAEAPVNNILDAVSIANSHGFNKIFITGNITLSTGDNVAEFVLIGENPTRSIITINPAAVVTNTQFKDAEIQGTLDGGSTLTDCQIGDLNFVDGTLHDCRFNSGSIVMSGANDLHAIDCYSGVIGTGTPVIDFGGAGGGVALRSYNGGIKFVNKSGSDSISVDLNSGQIVLADSVTGGTLVARGIGKLIDEAGNHIHQGTHNGVTIINEIINLQEIADHVWDEATIDHQTLGTTGQALTSGSAGGLSSAQTAAAVWDADPDNYKTVGSFGQWFRKIFWSGKRNT